MVPGAFYFLFFILLHLLHYFPRPSVHLELQLKTIIFQSIAFKTSFFYFFCTPVSNCPYFKKLKNKLYQIDSTISIGWLM